MYRFLSSAAVVGMMAATKAAVEMALSVGKAGPAELWNTKHSQLTDALMVKGQHTKQKVG